jgi:polyhydroxyalkanoate synthesis regulator phasin
MLDNLKETAEKGRILYNRGEISREEAKEYIMPYINACNEKSKEIAKKYGMKPKTISFGQYMR